MIIHSNNVLMLQDYEGEAYLKICFIYKSKVIVLR